jgi:hypothetical protein
MRQERTNSKSPAFFDEVANVESGSEDVAFTKLSNATARLLANSSPLRFIGWSSVLKFPFKDGLEHVCVKGEPTLTSLFAEPGDNLGRPVKVNSHKGFPLV